MQRVFAIIALSIAVRFRYVRDVEEDFAASAEVYVPGRAGEVAVHVDASAA